MLEQALRTFLISKTAIAAIIVDRCHLGDYVPVKAEEMPMLGIECEPSLSQQCLDGTACDLQFPVFEIVAKCRLHADSDKLIRLARKAFLGVPLGMTVATTVDGAPLTVTVEQVDLLSEPYSKPEEDYGHGFTIKPRAQKIRVGWREPVDSI